MFIPAFKPCHVPTSDGFSELRQCCTFELRGWTRTDATRRRSAPTTLDQQEAMVNISESPGAANEIAELVVDSVKLVEPLAAADGKSCTLWLDEYLYEWQQSGMPPKDFVHKDDLIPVIGAVWANTVIMEFGWEWVKLTFHEYDNWTSIGIATKDRALMILPFAYIHECLSMDDEVKIEASMVVLASDMFSDIPEGSYTNLMHEFQRILPRA